MENMDNKEFVRIFTLEDIGILYASVKFAIDNNIFKDQVEEAQSLLEKIIHRK